MRDARSIAELLLNETRARIALRGIDLQVTAPLMRLICQEGYSQVWAQPSHALTCHVENCNPTLLHALMCWLLPLEPFCYASSRKPSVEVKVAGNSTVLRGCI